MESEDKPVYETYDATDEKQAEQDAVCGWGNPLPTDYEMKQAYANQTSIGIGRVGSYDAGFEAGHRMGLETVNYQDEQRRNQALALAIQYTQGREDASVVVKNAQAFLAFLKGDAS